MLGPTKGGSKDGLDDQKVDLTIQDGLERPKGGPKDGSLRRDRNLVQETPSMK